jgi:hypothetical protein
VKQHQNLFSPYGLSIVTSKPAFAKMLICLLARLMTKLVGRQTVKIIKPRFANLATPIVIDEIVAKR